MTVNVVDNDEDFYRLKDEWQQLLSADEHATVFQTWEFLYYCWRIFSPVVKPVIVTVRDTNGELVGCAPLGSRIVAMGPLKIKLLGFAPLKYSDYSRFIVKTALKIPVYRALAQWFKANRKNWDRIYLYPVREDAPMIAEKDLFLQHFYGDVTVEKYSVAPYLTIDKAWTDYQGALSRKRAKSVRYEVKNLFRRFPSELHRAESGIDLDRSLAALFDLHQKRIHEKYQLGAFADPEVRERFRELVHHLGDKKYIEIFTIRSGSQTIAALGTFKFRGRILYFQGGFDTEYQRLSPGKVIQALCITQAIHTGADEFDFLCGDEKYKSMWSTGSRDVFSIRIGQSLKGRLLGWFLNFKQKLLNSDRFRAFYFKFFHR